MALTRFTEEDGLDAASRAQGLFDEADAFDADAAGFSGQAAAKGHAKGLEPAIVAAGENRGRARWASQTGVFAGSSHPKGSVPNFGMKTLTLPHGRELTFPWVPARQMLALEAV